MFSISIKQRKIFYLMLSIVWLIAAINSMVKQSFIQGLIVLVFGVLFILSIALVQSFSIRMIKLYDKNLKKSKSSNRNNKKSNS
ncbi:hypothetical protein [Thermoanaerobacterium sp. RBIITD]|uniref:hypothetical protein n=1 Tax=Thermoanaerobacterium sp. RBIITD TaxID=1550240 RepID=UPI000BB805A1|nr:hypothetical protein [Thermoanaerobacterium sp. RBIITD]SNX53017.1 hypothetical protein SAMN05660242_0506 [Thermoanaerobacterium sp. RBIITD]